MQKPTRKDQREQTRTGLVDRAEALFAQKGIAQTTTADVAKALKVSHGTVFLHFATRDMLVLEVVERFGERLSKELNARLSEDLSLAKLLRVHIETLATFEDFYLRLISESQSLPAKTRSIVYAINASLSYRFFRAAKGGMTAGKIKKLDQATFFNTWMALVHYHVMNRDLFADSTPLLTERGDDLIHQFQQLIKT